jgi:hypothetical protein
MLEGKTRPAAKRSLEMKRTEVPLEVGGPVRWVRPTRIRWLSILVASTAIETLVGCIDRSQPIPGPGQAEPVERISQMNLFAGPLANLEPRAGIVAYDVNAPAWSDGADKRRFIWVPPGTRMKASDDRFEIPVGAYLIKNFFVPNDERDSGAGIHLIETRFLVKTEQGMTASTYVWNDAQDDAIVSGGNLEVPVQWIDAGGVIRSRSFHVPGTSLCDSCHAGQALGLRARQIVSAGSFADGTTEQAEHLVAAAILDAVPFCARPTSGWAAHWRTSRWQPGRMG